MKENNFAPSFYDKPNLLYLLIIQAWIKNYFY
jgi:hypothetical protein